MKNDSQTTLEERQAAFDAREFYMTDRTNGLRYCDTMTLEQFEQMKKNRDAEHAK